MDYLRFLYEQEAHPLDDFDYELAKRADENIAGRTMAEVIADGTPIEKLMEELGITREDLNIILESKAKKSKKLVTSKNKLDCLQKYPNFHIVLILRK